MDDDILNSEDWFAERAAIMQFDGCMPRHQAEFYATVSTVNYCLKHNLQEPRDIQYKLLSRGMDWATPREPSENPRRTPTNIPKVEDELTPEDLNKKLVLYLMSSYLYYVEGRNVLEDSEFDLLCKDLLDHWDSITHWHKSLTTKEDLEAGTGYAIVYPLIVIGAARQWYYEHNPITETRKKSKRR